MISSANGPVNSQHGNAQVNATVGHQNAGSDGATPHDNNLPAEPGTGGANDYADAAVGGEAWQGPKQRRQGSKAAVWR